MERATTPGSHMDTQVVVAAIGAALIGFIVAAMIIYLGCFNYRRSQRISGAENATSSNLKNESALGGETLKRGKLLKVLN